VSEPIPIFSCPKHGQNAWNGEIACSKCSRTYSTKEPGAPMHAPPRCGCGCRLLPITDGRGIHVARPRAGKYYSMIPACSLCFAEMPGGLRMATQHDRGSPFCTGEQCTLHGAMIRKLARRAEAVAWAARKKVTGERVIEVQVPGTLGMTKLKEIDT